MNVANLVRNLIVSRAAWLSRLLDPRRDIEKECGHPDVLTIEDYSKQFRRGDVATRVVSLYPDESWSEDPLVYETENETETEFEKAWEVLVKKIPIYSYLHRADVLSGVGRFGIILLGVDDGLALDKEIIFVQNGSTTLPIRNLLYLRPLDESVVKVASVEVNVTNPRYGLPTVYDVNFVDPNSTNPGGEANTQSVKIHWTRVMHLADNRTNSEVFGMPRLEKVFNRILDLKKIAGGSGEMFWKGGFPGISMESQPVGDEEEIVIDKEATKEQMEAYMNGLQRYLATVGMTAKSLSVQVADPGPHLEVQLKLIAIAMSVPWRVFVGSEAAQLASQQDTKAWNQRLNRRREAYLSPFLVRPFIERLVQAGVLPFPKQGVIVDWGDMNALTEKDKAEVGKVQTEALAKYAQTGLDTLIPPFLYLTLILGMGDNEAHSIVGAGGEVQNDLNEPEPELVPAARQLR